MNDYDLKIAHVKYEDSAMGKFQSSIEKNSSAIAGTLERQTDELRHQADELKRQADELERQSKAQEAILAELRDESDKRSRDDKKYFWLGALVSLVTSILIEHGAELLGLLRQLLQLLTQAP